VSADPKNVSDSTAVLLAARVAGLVFPTNTQPTGKVSVRCDAPGSNLRTTVRPTDRLLVVSVRFPVRMIVLYWPSKIDRSRSVVAAYVSSTNDVASARPADVVVTPGTDSTPVGLKLKPDPNDPSCVGPIPASHRAKNRLVFMVRAEVVYAPPGRIVMFAVDPVIENVLATPTKFRVVIPEPTVTPED
jgi:hypothetical protein